MLAIYYLTQDNFVASRHLLSGASHVFRESRSGSGSVEMSGEAAEKVSLLFMRDCQPGTDLTI
jgi:hypothetical protein